MIARPSSTPAFRPLQRRGRRAVGAILLTFALCSVVTVALSIRTTSRSRHHAAVFQVAARQQTLANRYVSEVLLALSGRRADPATTAKILTRSAQVLLRGGVAPEVEGEDDDAAVRATTNPIARRQLVQARRLVADLTATGTAILGRHPATAVRLTAGERIASRAPVTRLRVLAALAANVSRNAEQTIATSADANIDGLIVLQIVLGIAGLALSLMLALALIGATRRQTAHFRSLVISSTDLVLVLGRSGCVYAGEAVTRLLGLSESEVLGDGLSRHMSADDWRDLRNAYADGMPAELVLRMRDRFGEWRQLEAHVTDLREDREVRGIVINARDVTERLRLEEQLLRQAFHDDLTGLPNRALFWDRVDQAMVRGARSHAALAVLMIDLDEFKAVNDTLGHGAGDQLLREVAARFTEVVGPRATLARLGGDEFALLLERAAEGQAVAVAQRLLGAARRPFTIDGREFSVSASIGIVAESGVAGDSAAVLRNADVAMYAAKAGGRGAYEVFRPEMALEVDEQVGIEHDLRTALERGEMSVHYQPEIALGGDAITGVEALMRWHSPTRGMVEPSRFIPIAETAGLIADLGEFVLREACAQTVTWRDEGLLGSDFVTWVNVSVLQLAIGGFAALVEQVLSETGLAPECLGLEITETAIVEEGPTAQRTRRELERVHDLGVRIAIDDFGTGFSSLGQLRHFPIDMLKIDRSFVSGVEHDAKDAAIAAHLISLAHALGSLAMAEGIETAGQRRYFHDRGCDHAQGFLFSRPLPATELRAMLVADGDAPVARAA